MTKHKKPATTVGCSDWHLGWGIEYNKIGKLSIETVPYCPVNFIWKGRSQGRHGQISNSNAFARFILIDGNLKLAPDGKGSFPKYSEVIKSANILLREHNLSELPDDATVI